MRLLLTAAAGLLAASPACASISCQQIDPPAVKAGPKRPVTATDLIELREIGFSGLSDDTISASPDGRRVAFQLRRASLDSNDYCLAMFVVDLDHRRTWRRVDTGGQPIFAKISYGGAIEAYTNGVPQPSVPQWSHDGRWIYYLRRDHGVSQVWRANGDGGDASQVTNSSTDIERFGLSADGRSLIVATFPQLAAAQASIDAEGLTGYHFDERYLPSVSNRPVASGPPSPAVSVIDIDTLRSRAADANEVERLALSQEMTSSGLRHPTTAGRDGLRAELVPFDADRIFLADELRITDRTGAPQACRGEACEGAFRSLWWGSDGSLYFLKRDGWARNRSSLYRWSRSTPTPVRILSTEDFIAGCVLAGRQLVCTHEGSVMPRRIVTIDLPSGRMRPLFDPNPETSGLLFAPAKRLFWRNGFGVETFADLVLPVHRDADARLPMVVTQYVSQGFLRGGTGDEVPIQLMAGAGFAVLSLQHPRDYGQFMPARTVDDLQRNDLLNFYNRRSILSSTELGVRKVVDMGLVDPARVGLTGLSDGATAVQFAMTNSTMFAAYSASECCEEESLQSLYGPRISDTRHALGFPGPGDGSNPYWKVMSVERVADRINTPLLVQAADTEYVDSLDPWLVMRAHGKAMDVFVYPDEGHVKLQPRHREAVYRRELAWFAFWLQDRVTPLATPRDFIRWEGWKSALSGLPRGVTRAPASDLPMPPPLPARQF